MRNSTISCLQTRARLLKIALPPAYTRAWYCPDRSGHIQAFGVDARGRRQYRYHAEFRSAQEQAKYAGLPAFGEALPKIRSAVRRALSSRRLDRDRAIAAVVRLLDVGHLRVGNEAYARENRSFGATTLRRRHAKIQGETLILSFRGKSGVEKQMRLTDRALVTTVRRCQDLPGQHLFCYQSAGGKVNPIGSDDVNAWLREQAGTEVTARQFRTWWASVTALGCILGGMSLKTEILASVCQDLGNTPAVARKSYIHPGVMALVGGPLPRIHPRGSHRLQPRERMLLGLLSQAPGPIAREP